MNEVLNTVSNAYGKSNRTENPFSHFYRIILDSENLIYDQNTLFVGRADDVRFFLQDKRFSSNWLEQTFADEHSLDRKKLIHDISSFYLFSDSAQNEYYRRHYRQKLNDFAREDAAILSIIRTTLQAVVRQESIDFIKEIASPIRSKIMAQVLNLQWDSATLLSSCTEGLLSFLINSKRTDLIWKNAQRAFYDLFAIIEKQIDDPYLVRQMILLLVGSDFLEKLLINVFVADLQLMQQKNTKSSKKNYVVTEGDVYRLLKTCSPSQVTTRIARETVLYKGIKIEKGQKLTILLSAPNLNQPELGMNPNESFAFGCGKHFCTGAKLSIVVTRLFLAECRRCFSNRVITELEWNQEFGRHYVKRLMLENKKLDEKGKRIE